VFRERDEICPEAWKVGVDRQVRIHFRQTQPEPIQIGLCLFQRHRRFEPPDDDDAQPIGTERLPKLDIRRRELEPAR
jgi:hypothetical protein